MAKYELLPEQLIYEGVLTESDFFAPEPLDEEAILAIHDADYWARLKSLNLTRQEERKTGFPHSQQLIDREIRIMQGTVQGAEFALQDGVGFNVAGGTHHAFTDRGEGFCLLNDIALGAQHLLSKNEVSQVLVVDLDVHQGNGTAQIFSGRPEVFTFSMHGGKNYPMHKEISDRDVPLPDGIEDHDYLKLLDLQLGDLFEQVQPDFVFYQAGVDVLKSDKIGRLGMTIDGCKQRDRQVLEACKKHEVPVHITMGGGYSERLKDIVEAHANTYRLAKEIYF